MSIEIKNLSKSFGDNKVLDNVSFTIEEGKFTCLMAPSGKGKTTLAKILLSIEKADSGDVLGMPKKIAAVFQEDRLCESLSVSKNIRIACKHAEIDEVKSNLSQVGLEGFENRRVVELSGGQKRRVAVVRAVLFGADFTVFDEPFSGLDENTRKTVAEYIKNKLKGRTALIITHDEDDAFLLGLQSKNPDAIASGFSWCGRWDLNPYVLDTRPSNVPVCLFQHYRLLLCHLLTTRVIISSLL